MLMNINEQVIGLSEASGYFEKQKSPQKEICLKLREIIFSQIPNVQEEMKWGVPAYAGGKLYIVALKDHVNLGFSLKDLPEKKRNILEGSGKTMRHLKFYSLADVDELLIQDYLKSLLHNS